MSVWMGGASKAPELTPTPLGSEMRAIRTRGPPELALFRRNTSSCLLGPGPDPEPSHIGLFGGFSALIQIPTAPSALFRGIPFPRH